MLLKDKRRLIITYSSNTIQKFNFDIVVTNENIMNLERVKKLSISQLKKEITKKLKNKWGYSKHQIDIYWQSKKDCTKEELEKELDNI